MQLCWWLSEFEEDPGIHRHRALGINDSSRSNESKRSNRKTV